MMNRRKGILRILRYILLLSMIVLGLLTIVGTSEYLPGESTDNTATSTTSTTSDGTTWTYMVYIAGDNNLSQAAIGDINEMEQVGSSSQVNVVIQVDFSQHYTPDVPSNTMRGKITQDNDTSTINSSMEDMGSNVDMGLKATLTDFITWATTNYPANNYALVLWDHGAGWKLSRRTGGVVRGALQDETSGSFMTLPDLASAVNESGVHLDIINFDACLMAMYEVAYEFNGLTDYMVFSEEVEPGDGDPYDTILQDLVDNPNMTPSQLAAMITTKYREFYELSGRMKVTKSAVDMAKTAQLHNQISELAQLMNNNISSERPDIQSARDESINYEYPENRDLGDFLENYYNRTSNGDITNQITAIQTTLSEMVIKNEIFSPTANDAITGSDGLAIFLPRRDEVPDADLTRYSLLAINQAREEGDNTWGSFVNLLVTGETGQTALQTGEGNFVVMLTWDTDADLDLIIREPDGTLAGPAYGPSSPNGFSSQDSYYSGESTENYAAAEIVASGNYDILVNYYVFSSSTDTTTASIYIKDPANGINEFPDQPQYQREMDLSNPVPGNYEGVWDDIANDVYTDWWWPHSLTRSLNGEASITLNEDIHLNFIVNPFKEKIKRLPPIED